MPTSCACPVSSLTLSCVSLLLLVGGSLASLLVISMSAGLWIDLQSSWARAVGVDHLQA